MVRAIQAPHFGHPVKLGRKRPPIGAKRLRLKDYLTKALPTPPARCDFSGAASVELANIYGNDVLGDCVVAGGYHVVGVETGNANLGQAFQATPDQIIADYSAIGGYVPGDPSTDNGCDEQTALNYWQQTGFADGTKLLGWLAVDATLASEVQLAMFLFENLFFGLELPDEWISPFPAGNGFTWDVAGDPNPQNGHCVVGVGYDGNGVKIDTWGMLGTMTYDAIAKYCSTLGQGELYVLLTPDQLAKGQALAPNGIAWTSLLADFNAMGGNVPVPLPPPAPPVPAPPVPAPPTPPSPAGPTLTLQQAQQAASDWLAAVWPTITSGGHQ